MVLRLLAAIVAVACVADDMPLVPPPTTDAHESAANKVDVLGFTLGDAIPDGVEKKTYHHGLTVGRITSHRWCEDGLWADEIDGSVELVRCFTTSVDGWVRRLRTRYGRETYSDGRPSFWWCRPGHVIVVMVAAAGSAASWFRYSDPCSKETMPDVKQHMINLLGRIVAAQEGADQEDF